MDNWVWIVVAIVVLLLVIGAVLAVARKRKEESDRREADELRQRARHLGSKHAELLREADELDPDVDPSTSESAIVDRPPPERGIN